MFFIFTQQPDCFIAAPAMAENEFRLIADSERFEDQPPSDATYASGVDAGADFFIDAERAVVAGAA